MSSNGFLSGISLFCWYLQRHGLLVRPVSAELRLDNTGQWLLCSGMQHEPEILRIGPCFWAPQLAILSLRANISGNLRVLVWRSFQGAEQWRRARVRITIGV